MDPSVASDSRHGATRDIGDFTGVLPYMVSGSTCWHLFFTEHQVLMLLTPYPQQFGNMESQLEAAKSAWPPTLRHSGQLRTIADTDIHTVRLYGGRGRWRFPKLLFRTAWRPGVHEGQGFAYVLYFKRGPFTPDPEKAEYAKELLPRILPVPVELLRF